MIFTIRMIDSQTNGWVDTDGNMYIIYSNQELMDDMHCNSYTVKRLKKELKDIGKYGQCLLFSISN